MYRSIIFQFLILTCIPLILNIRANAFEYKKTTLSKQNSIRHLCDSKLMHGVRFYKTDIEGKKLKIRLRFAPLELSLAHQKGFSKFREEYEKKYGAVYGANSFERLMCRYYFGSYEYNSLPTGVAVVDQLLRECPLKTLEHLVSNDHPISDCAPAVVDCTKSLNQKTRHPLNRIACERIEK